LNGANVSSGTIVSAWINGVKYIEVGTSTYEGSSVYMPADNPDTPEKDGGVEGDLISHM
jgi:hypothetical protein